MQAADLTKLNKCRDSLLQTFVTLRDASHDAGRLDAKTMSAVDMDVVLKQFACTLNSVSESMMAYVHILTDIKCDLKGSMEPSTITK